MYRSVIIMRIDDDRFIIKDASAGISADGPIEIHCRIQITDRMYQE